jgi:hypothetical protein
MTRHDLNTRFFAAELDCCSSLDDILNLLQKQAFSRFSKEDEKLLAWLNPAVLCSSRFQQRLAKVIGLVGRLLFLPSCSSTCVWQPLSESPVRG